MRKLPPNTITWYLDELVYLKKNFYDHSARQLLEHINQNRSVQIHISSLRDKCRELGLFKSIRPDLWLPREVNFLLNNYRKMGNIEMCEHLNAFKNRSREFTAKTIWKKMQLMKIHRSEKELLRIRKKNIDGGMYAKSQHIAAAKRRYPEGKTVIRKNRDGSKYYYIKHGDQMVQLHRFRWVQHHGIIPSGHKIYFKDGNTLNCRIENLICRKAGMFRYKKKFENPDDVFLRDPGKPKRSSYNPVVPFPSRSRTLANT